MTTKTLAAAVNATAAKEIKPGQRANAVPVFGLTLYR
jgi:hypothetical protein